jgi:hypothetical protein
VDKHSKQHECEQEGEQETKELRYDMDKQVQKEKADSDK